MDRQHIFKPLGPSKGKRGAFRHIPYWKWNKAGVSIVPPPFCLSLEPFFCTIRLNPDIVGLEVGNSYCKISAYADDLLFSLTNPRISLPYLLREFKIYGAISHLKINFSKSEAMGVAVPPTHPTWFYRPALGFKWTTTALKYLGTKIPPDLSRTYDLNFFPLLTKTHTLLEKWHSGLHSWFGRYNLIKISILPKFIYLIQALPIQIPPSFFRQVQALFTRFVWAHNKPRIRRSQMALPKHCGGLALPDVQQYYLASHLGCILDWRRNKTSKLWVQIEQSQTYIPLKSALWCYGDLPTELKSHPLMGTTLRHSHLVSIHTSLTSKNSPLFPILGHPNFELGLHRTAYPTLRISVYDHAAKFIVEGKWPSILELTDQTGTFQLPFWRAVQLHDFLHSLPRPQEFARQQTSFEDLCSGTDLLAHILSQTYTLLNTPKEQPQLPCLTRCERDLNCTFSAAQKQRIISLALKSSTCTKIQETNFKLLSCWYLTPSRLQKCFPSASSRCWRCAEEEGTLIHIF